MIQISPSHHQSKLTSMLGNPEKPNARFSTDLKGHAAGIEKVAFNPVKDAELCSLSKDGVAKFWDVRTKACVNEVKDLGDAHALAWAPDGSSLLVGNRVSLPNDLSLQHGRLTWLERKQSGGLFRISPTESAILSSHPQPVEAYQMSFCWSGKKVFLPTREGSIRILSYPELEPILHVNHAVKPGESDEFILKGHTAPCLTTELSPTGKYLATGGGDAIMSLFETQDWICKRTNTRIVGPVKSISMTTNPPSWPVHSC